MFSNSYFFRGIFALSRLYLLRMVNLQQICAMRGWNENSSDSQSIKTRLMAVWDGLQQSADDDQDGQVLNCVSSLKSRDKGKKRKRMDIARISERFLIGLYNFENNR